MRLCLATALLALASLILSSDARAARPVHHAYRVRAWITGYDDRGTTASGLPAGYGRVAVDPRVIPLGTHLAIPGYGWAVAADTGGLVRGYHIDLWFPTAGQCYAATGYRMVTVYGH